MTNPKPKTRQLEAFPEQIKEPEMRATLDYQAKINTSFILRLDSAQPLIQFQHHGLPTTAYFPDEVSLATFLSKTSTRLHIDYNSQMPFDLRNRLNTIINLSHKS